jgi:hypothetical protein
MTQAQRQARYRERRKQAAKEAVAAFEKRRAFQPPHGYAKAKQQLIEAGHQFVRIHDGHGREFGGVFVDGAYLMTTQVVAMASMSITERKRLLAEARRTHKDVACDAVKAYMETLRVSLDDLVRQWNG